MAVYVCKPMLLESIIYQLWETAVLCIFVLLQDRKGTIPSFYLPIDHSKKQNYNFNLKKNPKGDVSHVFVTQSDIQVTSRDELAIYQYVVDDCKQLLSSYATTDVFGIDCGDIVGDHQELYPDYLKRADQLDIPISFIV